MCYLRKGRLFLQTGKLTSILDLGLSLQNPNSIVMLQDFLVK